MKYQENFIKCWKVDNTNQQSVNIIIVIFKSLEYLIKKKFIHKVVLGTETYSKKDYDEILDFINDQIKIFNNNITDSTTIDKTNDDIVQSGMNLISDLLRKQEPSIYQTEWRKRICGASR